MIVCEYDFKPNHGRIASKLQQFELLTMSNDYIIQFFSHVIVSLFFPTFCAKLATLLVFFC